jgi:hypothetical protein
LDRIFSINNKTLPYESSSGNFRGLFGKSPGLSGSPVNEPAEAIFEIDCGETLRCKVGQSLESLIEEIKELPVSEHEKFLTRLPASLLSLYEWHNRQILIKRHQVVN